MQDLLGLNEDFHPKFLKKFGNLAGSVKDAVNLYHREVSKREYPSEAHAFLDT